MAAQGLESCSSCWENFDLVSRHSVVCPNCQTAICWPCLQQTMATEALMPCCSRRECRRPFDEIFLLSVLPARCRVSVRKHVRKVLVDQAKSRLPDALAKLEAYGSPHIRPSSTPNPAYEELKNNLREVSHQVLCLTAVVSTIKDPLKVRKRALPRSQQDTIKTRYQHLLDGTAGRLAEAQTLQKQFKATQKELKEAMLSVPERLWRDHKGVPMDPSEGEILWDKIAQAERMARTSGGRVKVDAPCSRPVFPCGRVLVGSDPTTPCRGMLNTHWQCVVCKGQRCKSCHAHLEGSLGTSSHAHLEGSLGTSSHACKPEDVATARLVMADSQACPGCGTRISRVQGCDHMWCTACNTSFSYKSGQRIADSNNTNPHYHQWKREHAAPASSSSRSETQGTCENAATFFGLFHVFQAASHCRHLGYGLTETMLIMAFHRLVDPGYGRSSNFVPEPGKADDIIERYALGLLTEKQFEENLFRHYRKLERMLHHSQIYSTLELAGREILETLRSQTVKSEGDQLTQAILELVAHIEHSLAKVNSGLGYSSRPRISPGLNFCKDEAEYKKSLLHEQQRADAHLSASKGEMDRRDWNLLCKYAGADPYVDGFTQEQMVWAQRMDYRPLVQQVLLTD